MNDAERIRAFSESHSPVFIVGMERGGTSILCQTLATAPCFGDVKSYLETFVFDDPESILSPSPRDMTVEYLGGPEHLRKFRAWFAGIEGWPEPWQQPRRIVTAYFYYVSQVLNDNARIIEKTPRHVFSIPMIRRFFPKCRIVGILRNPFGVIESYRKRLEREIRLGHSPADYGWLDKTPEQICAHIQKITDATLHGAREFPNHMMMISYDELLRDPELVFGLVSDFCNIEGVALEVQEEMPELDATNVDPLLQTKKIIRGNEFKSSIKIETRKALVRHFPELFLRSSGVWVRRR